MKYLTAAVALMPILMASATGYGLLPLLRRPLAVYSPASSLLREYDDFFKMPDFPHNSPKYEITNTNDKFQVAVDVPGVKPENIVVNLENDGQVLTLSGEVEDKNDDEGWKYSSKFYQSFTLDPAIKTEELTANLKDGVLLVTAPKDPAKLPQAEEKVQNIPITQNPHKEVDIPVNRVQAEQKTEEKEPQVA